MVKKLKPVTEVKERGHPDTRFRRAPGCSWEYGWFLSRDTDGSVNLVSEFNRATRTVFADRCEFKCHGTRGKLVWVSAEGAERPIAT